VTPSQLNCISELQDELSCGICLEICVRPCATPCGEKQQQQQQGGWFLDMCHVQQQQLIMYTQRRLVPTMHNGLHTSHCRCCCCSAARLQATLSAGSAFAWHCSTSGNAPSAGRLCHLVRGCWASQHMQLLAERNAAAC
jgi:hypothetical protein